MCYVCTRLDVASVLKGVPYSKQGLIFKYDEYGHEQDDVDGYRCCGCWCVIRVCPPVDYR